MKILIDENLPKHIKNDFLEFEIFTVREMQWNGKKNGELLSVMQENGFSILLTYDKNMQYQQNLSKYRLTVFVIDAPSNRYSVIQPYLSLIIEMLRSIDQYYGAIVISTPENSTSTTESL